MNREAYEMTEWENGRNGDKDTMTYGRNGGCRAKWKNGEVGIWEMGNVQSPSQTL